MPDVAALLAASLLTATPAPAPAAGAAMDAMDAAPEAMELVGSAGHRIGFWTIYDAYLYAPEARFSWDRPFALTLRYRRSLSAARIADVSIDEMARLSDADRAAFAPLRDDLVACFADVAEGDEITGYSPAPGQAVFTHNGRQTCALERAGFRRDFFGIWLSDNSRRPDMTRELRGEAS